MPNHSNIIEGGSDNFRRTRAYKESVARTRKVIEDKYKSLSAREKGVLLRLILKVKMALELRREIAKLDSPEKLFAGR
jgi:hypothetical protein